MYTYIYIYIYTYIWPPSRSWNAIHACRHYTLSVQIYYEKTLARVWHRENVQEKVDFFRLPGEIFKGLSDWRRSHWGGWRVKGGELPLLLLLKCSFAGLGPAVFPPICILIFLGLFASTTTARQRICEYTQMECGSGFGRARRRICKVGRHQNTRMYRRY